MVSKKRILVYVLIAILIIVLTVIIVFDSGKNTSIEGELNKQGNEKQTQAQDMLNQSGIQDCLDIDEQRKQNNCVLSGISESEVPRQGCEFLQPDLREICEKMKQDTLRDLLPVYQCWFGRDSDEYISRCFDMGMLMLDFEGSSNACDQFLFLKEECRVYIITQQALRNGDLEKCATISVLDQKQKCEKEVDRFADNDKDGLNTQDEEYYNTDPSNPDTDGDGYADGEEVMSGYNPLGTGSLIMP